MSAVRIVKFSGSAPYVSTFASCVASAWVKLPVTWKVPPGMAPLVSGAVVTFPSRTTAMVSSQKSSSLVEALG